jgi:putative iron-dependent peroxidase
MPLPQPGIFALGTRAHHHLELDLVGDPARVGPALVAIREATTSVAGVNVVSGLGPRLHPGVEPFEPIVGPDGFTMPATQHDLWLWFHGTGPDSVFDLARLAALALADVAEVRAEHPTFTYGPSRDLSGFEDGTENPPIHEAPVVATAPDGSSVVLVQRWVHDLAGLEALEVHDRELVIGRTFDTSEELPDDVKPPTAHIARVVIEDDDGEELEVFRRSTAFGGVLEHGLLFVAFSADQARLRRMLQRMAGAEDGVRDQLTRFSTPTTGAWYLAPSVEALGEMASA